MTVPGLVSHTSIPEPARNSAIGGHHEAVASGQPRASGNQRDAQAGGRTDYQGEA